MKENRESQIFKKKLSNIKRDLRMLREQELIDQETFMDFFFLTSNATTFDQLDQLTQDLAEICQRKLPSQ
jgi:ribosomal protein L19E